MTGLLVCLSAAALGVDFGWQPIAGGGIEYVIQIEPQMLEALKQGEDLSSALPAGARNIRRYRIVVGDGRLPHHGEPLPEQPAEKPPEKPAEKQPPAKASGDRSSAAGESGTTDDNSATDEAAANWTMPLASPYPPDYERAGIPLPGPVLKPALIAGPALEAPALQGDPKAPAAGDVAQADEQPAALESHRAGKPAVAESHATEPAASHSSVKASRDDPPAGNKEHAADGGETPSASDAVQASVEPPPSSTTLVGLFASLGGNVFLLWVASGQRSRYRALLRRSRESLAAASIASLPDAPEEDDSPRWEAVGEEEELETD